MEIELAIYEDCLSLIDKFLETNSPCFESFSEIWKSVTFQHIYAAQTTTIEVIQTTKTILHLAKRIALSKDEDERNICRRIAGIYLMYAVYFKQPTNQYVKVLLNYETWQDLLKFMESLPVNNMADEARYIFWNLYKEDAFRFVAYDYDLGLENLVDYDKLYDTHNGSKYVDVVRVKLKQKLMAITETDKVLPSMVSLEDLYNNSKESLQKIDKCMKPLPKTKIFHDVQDAIMCIHNILSKDGPNTISMQLNENKRKELKRKAAGYTTNDEESPTEENSHQGGTKKHFGKPTVRTLMTQELPEFIIEDLKTNSTDED